MSSRFIIIAILISIKVTGIASRAKAEVNMKEIYTNFNQTTCQGFPCDTTWDSIKNPIPSKRGYYNNSYICLNNRYECHGVIIG